MPSKGKKAIKLVVVAALTYAIMIICYDSLELDLVDTRRRVLSYNVVERRSKRSRLRKIERQNDKWHPTSEKLVEEKLPTDDKSKELIDHPPAAMDQPTPNTQSVPDPIDKTQKNRLVMNEFAKRSRVARLRTGITHGPVFHTMDFMRLLGVDLVLAQDKPKILNDGTYLIFQNNPYIFFHDQYIKPNLCWTLITSPNKIKRVHYHGGKCKDFDNQFGNRLGWVYGMKMIANGARIPFYFTCDISHGESPNGAAYLMTLNPRDNELGPVPKGTDGSDLTLKDVCRPCRNSFCGWNGDSTFMASDAMVQDWERLAASTMKPADDDTDDAVIHLRLGDAMYARSGVSEDKGLFPHGTYIRLLKQAQEEKGTISSIGIVTAPFKGEFVRANYDLQSTSTSAVVAEDLVNALQEAFPQAKISIHNSPDETIIGALTRIVNARKVAICGCSTFCPYPLLATKGIGYMFGPASTRHRQNDWIYNAAKRYNNFRLFETPMLNGLVIDNRVTGKKLDLEDVLEWIRYQDVTVGNIDVQEKPIFRANHVPVQKSLLTEIQMHILYPGKILSLPKVAEI